MIKQNIKSIILAFLGLSFSLIFSSPAISITHTHSSYIITKNVKDASTTKNSATNNFMLIADVHLINKTTRGMTLKPLMYNPQNDLDRKTFIKLLNSINKGIKKGTVPKPQFILLLGDIVGHEPKAVNTVRDDELAVFGLLKKTFQNIPIFYVFGNNDSFVRNYNLFTKYNAKKTKKESPYIAAMASGWNNGFLSTGVRCHHNIKDKSFHRPCLITENAIDGYYAAYINTNFRLITLNSVLFFVDQKDAVTKQKSHEELAWLKQQLQEAQKHNETALIAFHIPIGNNILDHIPFWRASCTKKFLKIINEYKDNIAGIIAAHTHMDELKVLQEQKQQTDGTVNTQNTSLMLFTAGLSTSHSNLPGIKTVFYQPTKDNNNWILSDYIAFNFTEKKNSEVLIKPLYTYRDTYCKDHINNNSNTSMLECLHGKNLADIINNVQKYYNNGNPHFSALILSPNDVYVKD